MMMAALFLASLVTGSPDAAATYTLSVGPLAEDLAAAVLSAEIEEPPDFSLALIESKGERRPAQVERTAGKLRVIWTAGSLKKGETAEWRLDLVRGFPSVQPRITAAKTPEGGVVVQVAGQTFTRLVSDPDEAKPYLYPILLDKLPLTRHWPMEKAPDEDRDHPHQRSLWFTHGSVNGVDFWSEGPKAGKILQTRLVASEDGDAFAQLATSNVWIAPNGNKLLNDQRTMRFYDLGAAGRMIDLTVVLSPAGSSVTFGDTKEGTFGIRLAESMKEKRGGRIVNSRGAVGMDAAWGKPAEWVDYVGKIGDRTVGVAIFDHPASFRHPTTWHVRDYGLFAANPFGLRDFTGKKEVDGSYRLDPGQSMSFLYRVFLHPGDTGEARVKAAYEAFVHPPAVKVSRADSAR